MSKLAVREYGISWTLGEELGEVFGVESVVVVVVVEEAFLWFWIVVDRPGIDSVDDFRVVAMVEGLEEAGSA